MRKNLSIIESSPMETVRENFFQQVPDYAAEYHKLATPFIYDNVVQAMGV